MEPVQFLSDWALNFIKNKDTINKKIVSVENPPNDGLCDFKIEYKDKVQLCIAKENICDFDFLSKIDKDANVWVTSINSKDNFDSLIRNWGSLINYKNLTICFVNPFSTTDTKWIIKPYIHNLISDPDSLELGLKSMFYTVEEVSIEAFKSKILSS